MAAWNLDTLASVSATGLVNSLAEGTLVAFVAWALVRLSGRRVASARFAVWSSALFLIAALPWVGTSVAKVSGSAQGTAFGLALPASWATGVFLAWVAGASLALLRVGLAFWQLLKLRWRCEPLCMEDLAPSLGDTVRSVGRFRGARVCVSDELGVPTAVGFFKPLIVIPCWGLEELSCEELNAVLIHELEHLRRWDDWTNLAQKLLRALLFFHPAVWWIDRNLALEREMACDDAVLAQTRNRHAYAACLVTIAEKSLVRRGLALAQAAVSRVQQTTLRVTQILQGGRESATWLWRPTAYLVGAVSVCGLVALSQAPLVEFQAGPASMASVASVATLPLKMVSENHGPPTPHVVLARAKRPMVQQAKAVAAKADGMIANSRLGQGTPAQGFVPTQQSVSGPERPAARTILVVFHGEQHSQFGTSYWMICVWQVDAPGRAMTDLEKAIPAKSI